MTRKDIMNIFANDPDYKQICEDHSLKRGIAVADDLYQELYLKLYEKPLKKLQRLYKRGKLKAFCVGLINTMFKPNDKFYRNHIRLLGEDLENIEIADEETPPDLTAMVQQQLTDLELNTPFGRYDKNVLQTYMQLGTQEKVSKKMNLNIAYVNKAIKRGCEFVRDGISREYPEILEMKNIKKYRNKKDKANAETEVKNKNSQFLHVLQKDGSYKKMTVEEYKNGKR